jgi:multidrug/hemolysin transport system permease protein
MRLVRFKLLVFIYYINSLFFWYVCPAFLAAKNAYLCLTFSAMAAFGASFIKSSGGFTSLSTIVGTGIGFLAGSFVPVGVLPDSVSNVINALPFSQAAMLMRQPLVADQLAKLAEVSAPAAKEVGLVYGMSINVGDWVPTTIQVILILLGVFLVFAGLSSLRIRSRIG